MKRLKRTIANYLLKHLLGFVVLTDIVTVDKFGNLFVGGQLVTTDELQALKAEVKALRGFKVWQIISETLKEDAYKRGFTTATSLEHLDACKSMLYNLDFQQSILRLIENKK